MVADESVPAFARGARFRYDEVRQSWVVLAPERLFLPDEQAVEVLKLIDGKRSLSAIADDLAARYGAPADIVRADVATMLGELAEKGVLRL